MKQYVCDKCGKVVTSEPEITLKGVVGTSGGILLPESLHEKHFCSTGCFWDWARTATPDEER